MRLFEGFSNTMLSSANEMNHAFLAEAGFSFLLETEDKLLVFLDKKHSPQFSRELFARM